MAIITDDDVYRNLELEISHHNLLCFQNRDELIKTLNALPDGMLCLVGYVDDDDIIRPLTRELLVNCQSKEI